MLRLRPYKPCDAEVILSWCEDEITFRRWTSDRYDKYPITPGDMNRKYFDCNGDCREPDNFYPMTMVDDGKVIGHLILRYTDPEQRHIRFGFVIVDQTKRGMGYGQKMLLLALSYAFDILKAEKVTLGVFAENGPARHCYQSVGFRDVPFAQPELCQFNGENWTVLEMEITEQEYQS